MSETTPITTTGTWTDPAGARWLARFYWAEVGGRLECVGMELRSLLLDSDDIDYLSVETEDITPKRLSAELLRRVPLGQLTLNHRDEAVRREAMTGWIASEVIASGSPAPGELAEGGRVGRPPEYGEEHWQDVATIYELALEDHEPPTKAVAEHFSVAKSTAGKWVARCRQYGLLLPTERGKARGRGEGR